MFAVFYYPVYFVLCTATKCFLQKNQLDDFEQVLHDISFFPLKTAITELPTAGTSSISTTFVFQGFFRGIKSCDQKENLLRVEKLAWNMLE